MTGHVKTRSRLKAFNKFKKIQSNEMSKKERLIFYTAFNMGWMAGKKRKLKLEKEVKK